MISFFQSKKRTRTSPLHVDMHSHLLAALDDGVKTHEEAISILKYFSKLGYKKIITTPHIMNDYYRNDTASIGNKLKELKLLIEQENIPLSIEAAAEYYLDEELMKKVTAKEKLLTFGDSYLLFETNFLTEPYQLNDFIFNVIIQGYKPILAHPERYQYMTMEKAEELRNRGVVLQVNIPSLIGFYSRPIQKLAVRMIDQGWISLLGSDAHTLEQARLVEQAWENKAFRKAIELPLLNNNL